MKKVRAGRRHPRGMTLLIALAVISVVTAATLVSLRVVSQESELQGRERHSREAFFAAEAGLSEGREVLTQLLSDPKAKCANASKCENFSDVMLLLGTINAAKPGYNSRGEVDDPKFPGQGLSWYELIPVTAYTLLSGPGQAVDPNVSKAAQEMRDRNNKAFLSFPEQRNVTYRVFVHDDEDEGALVANDRRIDNNHALWVVSVGEVTGADNVVMARSVVRALVFADMVAPQAGGYSGQKGRGSSKTSVTAPTLELPNLSQGTQI